MKRWLACLGVTTAAAAMALLVSSAPVLAGEPTPDESDCQEQTGGKIIPGFVKKKAGILVKCEKGERAAKNPSSDCEPPYGGNTAVKVGEAQTKAVSKITDKCAADCPECSPYSGNCATYASSNVSGIESIVDGFKGLVYCDDTGSTDGLNDDEAKCQDNVAKALAKYVKKIAKCASKCVDADRDDNGTTNGQCHPATLTDPDLIDCRTKAAGKAVTKIDDKCAATDNPECYVPNFDTGAEWQGLTGSTTDAQYASYYCQDA